MRKAGRIVAGTIDAVVAAVEPGRSTLDLDRLAERYIREQGAIPSFKGYRGTYPGLHLHLDRCGDRPRHPVGDAGSSRRGWCSPWTSERSGRGSTATPR